MYRVATVVACSVLLWWAVNVDQTASAVPIAFGYSGELLYDNGVAADGTFSFSVSLFPFESGGASQWGPVSYTDLEVNGGVFSLFLSNEMSGGLGDAVAGADALWMEIEVNGNVLVPRQQVIAVPYALHARDTE